MTRELLIFRHGKSDWTTDAGDDFDRPLAKRGRKAVKRMARWIREQELVPEHILSSPAKRARQTTMRLCRHGEIPESVVRWEQQIYSADLETLLQVLAGCKAKERTMIVGHNPGLEDLAEFLSGSPIPAPESAPTLPTAALVQLALPDDWAHLKRGCGRLLSITRPRELKP